MGHINEVHHWEKDVEHTPAPFLRHIASSIMFHDGRHLIEHLTDEVANASARGPRPSRRPRPSGRPRPRPSGRPRPRPTGRPRPSERPRPSKGPKPTWRPRPRPSRGPKPSRGPRPTTPAPQGTHGPTAA